MFATNLISQQLHSNKYEYCNETNDIKHVRYNSLVFHEYIGGSFHCAFLPVSY